MNDWDPRTFRQESSSEMERFTSLSQWRSIAALFINWVVIYMFMGIHLINQTLIVYLITVFVIGTRLYALYSLLHDNLHFLTLKNRKWNDRIGQIFMGFSLFIYVPEMRRVHFAHHKHLLTDKDPEMALIRYEEFQYPKSGFQLFWLYMKDLTAFNFLYYRSSKLIRFIKAGDFKSYFLGEKKWLNLAYLILLTLSIRFGWWSTLLVYWLIPYMTVYQLLNRIRLSTEHLNLGVDNGFHTRTMNLNWLEGTFLSPHHLGFHTEHHLFPSVPHYHLPKLHKMLIQDEAFKSKENVDLSYIEALEYCIE